MRYFPTLLLRLSPCSNCRHFAPIHANISISYVSSTNPDLPDCPRKFVTFWPGFLRMVSRRFRAAHRVSSRLAKWKRIRWLTGSRKSWTPEQRPRRHRGPALRRIPGRCQSQTRKYPSGCNKRPGEPCAAGRWHQTFHKQVPLAGISGKQVVIVFLTEAQAGNNGLLQGRSGADRQKVMHFLMRSVISGGAMV